MNKDSKIFVAGHRGLVGSSIVRVLNERGYSNILTRTRNELNLLNQKKFLIFLTLRNQNMFLMPPLKLAAFTLMTHILEILSMRTFRFKPI